LGSTGSNIGTGVRVTLCSSSAYRGPLTKHEVIVEEDDLSIDILNNYQKCFSRAVNFFIPTEIGDNGKVDTKERSSNRLDLSLQSDKPGERNR
jgi:hypothetical protein